MHLKLQKIIVEESAASYHLTKSILANFPQIKVDYVQEVKTRKEGFKAHELIIAKQKGRFVKKCPGTPIYNCCDYYVLNLGIGCFYNCTYCYLHYYMNSPFLVFANVEELLAEVKQMCQKTPQKVLRLGSGEFIDSIGFDSLTNLSPFLIENLTKIKNLIFEVKTKSKKIEPLLNLNHRGRAVISWSVNSPQIVAQEEQGTDSLADRIKAAARCQEAGYKVGFHFDPLIHYSGWQAGYKETVDLIFQFIKPKNIAWISLGALRFNPALKPVIAQKFPHSKIIYGELLPGLDGKLRYFITIRRQLFATLVKYIKNYAKDVPVYLCMENKDLAAEVGAIAPFTYATYDRIRR